MASIVNFEFRITILNQQIIIIIIIIITINNNNNNNNAIDLFFLETKLVKLRYQDVVEQHEVLTWSTSA